MKNRDRIVRTLLLVFVLTVGLGLRVIGQNWDSGWHLHPDERFLTMVGNAVRLPQNFIQYLNPSISPFNPANNGYPFFVYGTFPLLINKFISVVVQQDTYMGFTQMGRLLSALADTAIIYLVYSATELIALYMNGRSKQRARILYLAPFFAGFAYAVMVLPIQLSHFFAVDTFANLFGFVAFYYSLRILLRGPSVRCYFGIALGIGLAIGSKISMLFILPLIALVLAVGLFKHRAKHKPIRTVGYLCLLFLFSLIFLRLSSPYYFESGNILDLRVSTLYQANIAQLKSLEKPESGFPPALQWIDREPILFSLYNMSRFGMGLPIFILGGIGLFVVLFLKKNEHTLLQIIAWWMILFFIYQSSQITKAIRYFIILYPFFAIYLGYGVGFLLSRVIPRYRAVLFCCVVLALVVYALSYMSIYISPSTRIAASEWLVRTIPQKGSIIVEHWDDPLPLPITGFSEKGFMMSSAPVFDPDTPVKWKTMDDLTAKPHHYVLSSNRAWGSIMRVPDRYPRMSEFYRDMFNQRNGYKKVIEFHSYPSLRYLGIPIEFPDESAEETFTVYDHPTVKIYKR